MYQQAARRSGLPVAEQELDLHLQRTVRRTSWMRQGFYVVVLLVALAGQVSGAVETLHIPLMAAIPAVGALELGGIVVLANADVRRRLGERAVASRLLSVMIAAGAVAFNWLAHRNHLMGGFFAGMSALGYLVWLMHTENQRRDRLRAKGTLPPTTPAYEVVGHWVTHPWLTRRARSLAKADPELGLYGSLDEARAQVRRRRQQAAISKVLHRKIRSAVDPAIADIALAVYDLDEIARRLAAGADYDGLTALIAADLSPARLAASLGVAPPTGAPAIVDAAWEAGPREDTSHPGDAAAGPAALSGRPEPAQPDEPADRSEPAERSELSERSEPAVFAGTDGSGGATVTAGSNGSGGAAPEQALPHDVRRELGALLPPRRQASPVRTDLDASLMPTDAYPIVTPSGRNGNGASVPAPRATPEPPPPAAGRTRAGRGATNGRTPAARSGGASGRSSGAVRPSGTVPVPSDTVPSGTGRDGAEPASVASVPPAPVEVPAPRPSGEPTTVPLRRRVHDALDTLLAAGDLNEETELVGLVTDRLQLDDSHRFTIGTYVTSWKKDVESGRRRPAPAAAGPASAS